MLASLALALGLALPALALPNISVNGAKFFAGGQQFYIKGVAYQGTPSDPLVDVSQCQADATLMKSIGTNSIRVYHVNPYVSHDGCMSAFDDAGIYVWLDLDTFNTTMYQTPLAWTDDQLGAFAFVMDGFQSYDNLAGFYIGNEIITDNTGSPAAPYIRAAISDLKEYAKVKGYRDIPIGYSAADIAELRPSLQDYLACGNASSAIDFFSLNSYEWCGNATYENSGYSNLQAMAANYSIPIFISETGCNVVRPRLFSDQAAIFGSDMVDTWSGSIIYEWVQETNDYGVVTYPDGGIYNGAPIPINPDFTNLKSQWAAATPIGVASASYTPSLSAPACPSSTAGGWQVNGWVSLPTLGVSAVKAIAASSAPPLVTVAPTATNIIPNDSESATILTVISGGVTMTITSFTSGGPIQSPTGSSSGAGGASGAPSSSSSKAGAGPAPTGRPIVAQVALVAGAVVVGAGLI